MAAVDHFTEHYRAALQRMVPDELILTVGVFTHARRIAGTGDARVWPADDVALAAGTGHLVAVHYRPCGMEIDVDAVLATWPRDAVTVTLQETDVLRLLHVHEPDVEVIELRSPRQLGAFDHINDALYRDLGLSTPRGS